MHGSPRILTGSSIKGQLCAFQASLITHPSCQTLDPYTGEPRGSVLLSFCDHSPILPEFTQIFITIDMNECMHLCMYANMSE